MNKLIVQCFLWSVLSVIAISAQANRLWIGDWHIESNQVHVTISYDFTAFPMVSGGFDLFYDSTALEYVSYTPIPNSDFIAQLSPIGTLVDPGHFAEMGFGTWFVNGISSAGSFGIFVFDVLSSSSSNNVQCDFQLCLAPIENNPFVNLNGEAVTDEVLDVNGVNVVVPLPAAIWLLLGGLGVLTSFSRQQRYETLATKR